MDIGRVFLPPLSVSVQLYSEVPQRTFRIGSNLPFHLNPAFADIREVNRQNKRGIRRICIGGGRNFVRFISRYQLKTF